MSLDGLGHPDREQVRPMEQHLRACRPYALPAKDPALGDILAEFRVTPDET